MRQACGTCHYWVQLGEQPLPDGRTGEVGECHRYAPTIVRAHSQTPGFRIWPETEVTDWCGEWKFPE